MTDFLIPELWMLLPLAFVSGLIDSAVGGGGLIQIPGLFSILPNHPPADLLGTNKLASISGTAVAARQYSTRVQFDWSLLKWAMVPTFVCSMIGASAVSLLPTQYLRPIMLVLLLLMVTYTFMKKDLGQHTIDLKLSDATKKKRSFGLGVGIGLYDGFFGPGVGSILAFLYVKLFGYDFLKATGHSKVVNATTNAAALMTFAAGGHVLWLTGLLMGVSNIGGALCGTHVVTKYGAPLIRKIFIAVLSLTILKFTYDTIKMFM